MLIAFFIGVGLLIVTLISIDLGVFHRRGQAHVVGMREALTWSCIWVSLALCFNVAVYFLYGHNWMGFREFYEGLLTKTLADGTVVKPEIMNGADAGIVFLNGYLLELSLSMDNLFVFAAILGYFRVPLEHQHRVLIWGIIGAIILRGVMIALGAALVHMFDWIFYVFGVLLIWTAWKMWVSEDKPLDPERNLFVRLARRAYPVTTQLHGSRFFVVIDGVRMMTPLFLALLLVDVADVMFAVDSIPAIFGITNDTFIVFTSNMFAVMGLRSMYFALIGLMHKFHYLKPAIIALLAYIGVKMLLHDLLHVPNTVSLAVIFLFLGTGVVASLVLPAKHGGDGQDPGHGGTGNDGGVQEKPASVQHRAKSAEAHDAHARATAGREEN